MRRTQPISAPLAVSIVILSAQLAHAGEPSEIAKVHLAIGPTMAGSYLGDGWDTQVGGEIHLVWLAPQSRVGAVGAAFGATRFAEGDTTRLYLDSYVGLALSADVTLGLALGPVVDLFATRRPRPGLAASLWLHAGVAPYVSISRVWGLGASGTIDYAIGLRVPFSVVSF